MENKMFYTVYKVTNELTNEYYIGKHKQIGLLQDRYYCSGTKILESINLHGIENFTREIVYYYDNIDEANNKEFEWIEECRGIDPLCLNIMKGGKGGWDHVHTKEIYDKKIAKYGNLMGQCHTPEVREKIISTCKERYGSTCGHMHTEEVKKYKIETYGSLTGMMHTEEARNKSYSTKVEKYGYVTGACNTEEVKKRRIEKWGSVVGQCHTEVAIEKRKNTMKDLYGSTNGNCNSEEAIKKGRDTKYLKHSTNFPDLKIIVELIKDKEIVWSGEKYHLLIFLYGYEAAIKSKNSLLNKLDTNKTWKSNSKWNGYTIRTKK